MNLNELKNIIGECNLQGEKSVFSTDYMML